MLGSEYWEGSCILAAYLPGLPIFLLDGGRNIEGSMGKGGIRTYYIMYNNFQSLSNPTTSSILRTISLEDHIIIRCKYGAANRV